MLTRPARAGQLAAKAGGATGVRRMAASDLEALYRAAVSAALNLPEGTPLVRDIARTHARLTGVLAQRPRERRVLLTLEFDGDAPPRIREWARAWVELD